MLCLSLSSSNLFFSCSIWFYLSLAHLFLSYLFPAFPVESQHICFDLVLSPASKEGYTILVNSFQNLRIHRGRAYHRLWTTSRSYIGDGSSHEPGSYVAHTHSTLAAHPFFSIETTSHWPLHHSPFSPHKIPLETMKTYWNPMENWRQNPSICCSAGLLPSNVDGDLPTLSLVLVIPGQCMEPSSK